MKFNEIKTGMVFTIGETPSYPKLKTELGYIDMRDDIVNNNPNSAVLSSECRELEVKEIAKRFNETEEETEKWIKEVKQKYLPVK